MKQAYSLNGFWRFDYLSDAPYTDTKEPLIHENNESALSVPVPGYWEDMGDLFRTTALHTKLKWNPLYTLQTYPQAGYVPDMALPNPVGSFVYQKYTDADGLDLAGETELFFGGVQNAVSVWVNGEYLGRHEGYSAPFAFSVPKGVLKEKDNRITLAVSNHRLAGYMGRPVSGLTSRAANECTGGVYENIEIRTYPDGLKDAYALTSSDLKTVTLFVTGAESCTKTVSVLSEDKCILKTEIPAEKSSLEMDAEKFAFWTPDNPVLYKAVIETPNQSLSVSFGVRRLTAKGQKLFLNGEPYFFRGTCEHCYQPETVHPTREKNYYRAVIRKLKSLGFNSIRFHTWVPPKAYMEAADELGMLLEIESPNNTTFEEWKEIVAFCRRHVSVSMYSTGNEMQIDEDYEQHLAACAKLVHESTDSLFSPMSALRGVEYHFVNDPTVDAPFMHNPERLKRLEAFSDVFNSYSLGLTSYSSSAGTHEVLDERNAVYTKPLLSHEICIHGTYIDLSLEERYKHLRIGQTPFMSSVRKHLEEKNLLGRANLYYRNSAEWQRILRKHCFETVRRSKTFAGYDFLGDIDTHWHTFGYCVGMMNEFYELKPGETTENVLSYNSDTVLLADLPNPASYVCGARAEIPVCVSHYGKPLTKALLRIRLSDGKRVYFRKEVRTESIPAGEITPLYTLSCVLPKFDKPKALKLSVSLSGGDTDSENEWNLFVFPKAVAPSKKKLSESGVAVYENGCEGDTLLNALRAGKRVVLFGAGPFASREVSWQLSIAGRTNGHLATAIADHPLMEDFPETGYCNEAFSAMLNGSCSALLDLPTHPHAPVIDIASSYKNAHCEGMLFEYSAGAGKLVVCTLNLTENDAGAMWLKAKILSYACSDAFLPKDRLTEAELSSLFKKQNAESLKNANEALNKNDITA